MQGSYTSAFEKVSRKTRNGQRHLNQGDPHRNKRKQKQQERYA